MPYCKPVSIPVNSCCSANKLSKKSPRDQYLLNLKLLQLKTPNFEKRKMEMKVFLGLALGREDNC